MCNCDRQLLLQVAKVTTVRMCGVEQEDCRMHISNKELMRSNETTEVDEDLHRHHRMDPLRNITQSESSSISDKDNHKSQQVSNDKMLHSSRATSWSSSSESMTNDSRKFSHQSGQRRRSSCVSKKGHLRLILTTIAALVVLCLLAGQMDTAEAAVLRRRSTHQTGVSDRRRVWERPCGDGKYHEKSDNKTANKKKKSQIKQVFDHTLTMINKLEHQAGEPHWIDGNWEHALAGFQFPDISKFNFRKVHIALQQYMAIFQKFSTIENEDRKPLRSTFQQMQEETKHLLCMIESVINGTTEANRRAKAKRGEAIPVKKLRKPAYFYLSHATMDHKLQNLTKVLTEATLMPIAKVVFGKYQEFITIVRYETNVRMTKLENASKNGGGGGKRPGNGSQGGVQRIKEDGVKVNPRKHPVGDSQSETMRPGQMNKTQRPQNKKNKNRMKLEREEKRRIRLENRRNQIGGGGGGNRKKDRTNDN